MLVTKDARYDPRVSKERKSLVMAGYDVKVMGIREKGKVGMLSILKRLARHQLGWFIQSHKEQHDYIHAHDFDTLPMGVLISKLKGVPLVYDAHESYSDMVSNKLPEDMTRMMKWLEHKLTRHTSKIILANKKIGPLISDEPDKWIVVMNCVGDLKGVKAPSNGNGFTIGYFGSLEKGRFVQDLIESVKMARDWQLVIAGRGSLQLKGLDDPRIKHLGYVDSNEVHNLMAGCDLLSVMFEDGNANDRIGTPNRLFEAMALGVPVVANWNSYSGEITKETDCGFTIAPNMFPLKDLLEYLSKYPDEMKDKGNAGHKAWEAEYNWETQEQKLIALYEELKVK